jgi:signal transduction histidine kinase/CheY-like chemotaxis protein/HAMP domain-containing protein
MMKRLSDIKIQSKLFLAFGALISLLIILAVITQAQINSNDKNNNELISSFIERQSSVLGAIAEVSRMRYVNLVKAFLVVDGSNDDSNKQAIADMQESYNAHSKQFLAHLNDYRNNVTDERIFTEQDKQQRLQVVDEIVYLLTNVYQPKIAGLDTALYSADKAAVAEMEKELLDVGEQIYNRMDILYTMVTLSVEIVAEKTKINSQQTVYMLFGLAAILTVLSVFIALFMTKTIRKPIEQMEKAVFEIAKGNLTYPIRSTHNDEFGMLANSIGNMVDSISEMNKVVTVMDHLDTMVIVIDLDHNLVYINRRLADNFGVDYENYKGQKCYKALRNLPLPCYICQLPDLLPLRDTFPTRDYEFMHDETSNAWYGGKTAIIRWVDGSTVFFQTLKNESEKKKHQEVVEAASFAKSAFLANMSHELRTPLNVVVGLADLQLEDKSLPEDTRENLHKISNAGNTLLDIVNDILDISKIESGKFILAPVEYHMASLLNDTAILVTSRIKEKPLVFRLNIGDDLPSKLYGDDLRVKQILNNLLSNAIKFTRKGDIELSVHCTREDSAHVWMDISVKDSGVGIRPEDLKKLFSNYNQVDVQANRKVEGTGLGLVITKDLVESMDGNISVESEYGKGSTFSVRIRQGFVSETPIGAAVFENLRKFRYNENKRHFDNMLVRADLSYAKVLVVDDVQANLDVAAGLMRKYKMQVDCVTSGQAAIDRIALGKPLYNAIFMDHMMPEMDGIETADRIRELATDYARAIPIIALTANAVVGTEELFYEHGFQGFISKPIDLMRLDSVIKQYIKDKHVMDEIPGIDMQRGLAICAGDQHIYRLAVRSYVSDTTVFLENMRGVTEKTLPDYAIAVHGLKSASANIGANAIREAAINLEELALKNDLQGVLAKNDYFLQELDSLVSAIKNWLATQDEQVIKPRLPAPNRALLARLRQSCENYDMDGIDKAMDELDSASYDSDAELIAWLKEKAANFCYIEIAEQLAEYKS